MKWALLAVTRGALSLGRRLQAQVPGADLFTLPRWAGEGVRPIEGTLREFTGTIFGSYDVLVYIMAAGIAVRVIAGELESKFSDPAVLVMDEKGKFVISLLSGHWGGANEAAMQVAALTGAVPVITTASDVNETLSVDMLAKSMDCRIDDAVAAKTITAMIVNGEPVGIRTAHELPFQLPANLHLLEDATGAGMKALIAIGNRVTESHLPRVHLVPGNIVIGLGCRRGIKGDVITGRIREALGALGLHELSIKCIAVPDLKEDEQGVHEAASRLGTTIRVVGRETIKAVEHRFEGSEFVRHATGVGAICEPCAFLASSGRGRFLMQKNKEKGVALALWEET